MEKKRKEQRHLCDSPAFIKFCLSCTRPRCNNCITSMNADERKEIVERYALADGGR